MKTVGGVVTRYPSQFYEVTGGTTTKHLYAGNTLIGTIENGDVSHVHSDHLGSTNVVTDDIGYTTQVVAYYPFGNQRIEESYGGMRENLQYVGTRHDAETDLNLMGARYADTRRGQFISQDPVFQAVGDWKTVQNKTEGNLRYYLQNPQTHNSYSYAFNNPINYKDSNGEFAFLALPIIYAPQILAATAAIANSALLTSLLADDLATLFDQNASGGEKAFIAAMLLTGPGGKAGSALVKNGDKLVPVFRGGSGDQLFNIKPNEIKVDGDGFVMNTRGVSVNTDASSLNRFGGANQIEYLPDTLKIDQIGNANHYEIVPTGKLTPDEFQSELGKIKTRKIEN